MTEKRSSAKLTVGDVLAMLKGIDKNAEFCYAYWLPLPDHAAGYRYQFPKALRASIEDIADHKNVCVIRVGGP